MTPVQIVHMISPKLSVPFLASFSRKNVSATLLAMLGSKSLAEIVKSYKGFGITPGAAKFQIGILPYISMAVQFDQPDMTVTVVRSLGNLTGK